MSSLNRLSLLAGLAGLVLACGSGDNASDSPKGCNLVTNYPCKTEEGRVCVPNPEKPGEGICVWKDETGNDVIGSKDTYSSPDNSVTKDNSQPVCESHIGKICSGNNLYWKDSCGNLEEKSESCDNGCSNGKCQAPGCESHAGTVCSDGDVYWKDSCGNLEDKSKSCDNGCSNGKCQGQTCTPHENKVCSNGDVYWQDSCGALEEKSESCDYDCDNGECQEQVCESHTNALCFEGDVYWKNSCGDLEEKLESCDYGCSNGECNQKTCTDECSSWETKCDKQDIYYCEDSNGDGCLEWIFEENCIDNSNYCLNGCNSIPYAECDSLTITYEDVCDGVNTCYDNSDEGSFCNQCQNKIHSCQEIVSCLSGAKDGVTSYLCLCQGYTSSIKKLFELTACHLSNCGGPNNITPSCIQQTDNDECSYAWAACFND